MCKTKVGKDIVTTSATCATMSSFLAFLPSTVECRKSDCQRLQTKCSKEEDYSQSLDKIYLAIPVGSGY